jgi:hypothetical protein
MAYNTRGTDSTGSQAGSYPVTRVFAVTVIAAIVFLAVLRFFYGSIRVEAGVR